MEFRGGFGDCKKGGIALQACFGSTVPRDCLSASIDL